MIPSGDEKAVSDLEYAAARDGAAIFRLSERGLLAVSGPVRQKFLNGILTNDVARLWASQGCRAALLDTKGHVLALVRVLATETAVVLETDLVRRELLEERLAHYRVAAPVRFAADPKIVLGLLGAQAGATLGRLGLPAPEEAEAHVAARLGEQKLRVVRAQDLPGGGYVLHVPEETAARLWPALLEAGAAPLGRRTLDTLRIEDGRPFWGADVSEDNLLHETGLVAELHSPTKGCYVGQEIVARLSARGEKVNKALRGLELGAEAAAGTEIRAEGRSVGQVTTAGRSPRRGAIALGYVARSHFEPGSAVEVGGSRAVVRALPFEG
jgi:folate-binding protein YgfZ